MVGLLSKNNEFTKFTLKYNIEIPYLYALIWDLNTMGTSLQSTYEKKDKKRDGSYMASVRPNIKTYIKHLSDYMCEIALGKSLWDCKNVIDKGAIKMHRKVSFVKFLPYLREVEFNEESRRNVIEGVYLNTALGRKIGVIKKEILKSIPLLPMEINKKQITINEFRFMLDVLREENKTDRLNKKLLDKNNELEKANEKIKSIIRSFAHRAEHVEADNIFSVATTLQKNNGNPEDIKKLLLCYEENLDLKRNINILKLEASNDYASFKSSVEDSIAFENNGSVLNIFDIINASLKRIFSKILYTDSERTFHIRKSMEQSGIEMDKLVEKYRENILIKDGNCLELLCDNFDFLVDGMSEKWNEVRLFKDSDGTTILVSLFMELFLNMFTYADFSKKIRLFLSNDKLDRYPYLSIELLNSINDEKKVFSTQAGIISTNETLKLLNSDKDGKNEVEEYIPKETTEDGLFKTKILLREYLFL